MTGWLGSGIPIPGLRKNEPTPAESEAVPVEPAEVAEPRAEGKDDDDNSRYIRYEGLADVMSWTRVLLRFFCFGSYGWCVVSDCNEGFFWSHFVIMVT